VKYITPKQHSTVQTVSIKQPETRPTETLLVWVLIIPRALTSRLFHAHNRLTCHNDVKYRGVCQWLPAFTILLVLFIPAVHSHFSRM